MKKKTKFLQVRVTEEQHDKFTRFANRNEVSKSEIIRGFVLKTIRKLKDNSN